MSEEEVVEDSSAKEKEAKLLKSKERQLKKEERSRRRRSRLKETQVGSPIRGRHKESSTQLASSDEAPVVDPLSLLAPGDASGDEGVADGPTDSPPSIVVPEAEQEADEVKEDVKEDISEDEVSKDDVGEQNSQAKQQAAPEDDNELLSSDSELSDGDPDDPLHLTIATVLEEAEVEIAPDALTLVTTTVALCLGAIIQEGSTRSGGARILKLHVKQAVASLASGDWLKNK